MPSSGARGARPCRRVRVLHRQRQRRGERLVPAVAAIPSCRHRAGRGAGRHPPVGAPDLLLAQHARPRGRSGSRNDRARRQVHARVLRHLHQRTEDARVSECRGLRSGIRPGVRGVVPAAALRPAQPVALLPRMAMGASPARALRHLCGHRRRQRAHEAESTSAMDAIRTASQVNPLFPTNALADHGVSGSVGTARRLSRTDDDAQRRRPVDPRRPSCRRAGRPRHPVDDDRRRPAASGVGGARLAPERAVQLHGMAEWRRSVEGAGARVGRCAAEPRGPSRSVSSASRPGPSVFRRSPSTPAASGSGCDLASTAWAFGSPATERTFGAALAAMLGDRRRARGASRRARIGSPQEMTLAAHVDRLEQVFTSVDRERGRPDMLVGLSLLRRRCRDACGDSRGVRRAARSARRRGREPPVPDADHRTTLPDIEMMRR